jgi:hypothetical protein
LFLNAEKAIERIRAAEPDQYFKHSISAKLNRKNTSKLFDIHTRHLLSPRLLEKMNVREILFFPSSIRGIIIDRF